LGECVFKANVIFLLVFCMVFHRQTSALCAHVLGQLDGPQWQRGSHVFAVGTALSLR